MTEIPKVTLSNGIEMPALGFGVFQMNNEETEESVVTALKTGYRLIDTAAVYGNEEAVGKAIKASGVPREEIFITTKLWVGDASYDKAKKAYQASLEKLGLEYVDLYIIHQPYGDIFGAWKALVELYEAGKVKAIGVSNFNAAKLRNFIVTNQKILGVETLPMVNQIETHPYNQEVAAGRVMEEYGVVHEGWGPFAEGRLDVFNNEVLVDIAKDYEKTVGQVILRWHIQKGIVAIPKSVRTERIEENFNVFDFELSDDDMAKIATLDNNTILFDHEDPDISKALLERVA